MGHTEANSFNVHLLSTIINNIVVVDDDASKAAVGPHTHASNFHLFPC